MPRCGGEQAPILFGEHDLPEEFLILQVVASCNHRRYLHSIIETRRERKNRRIPYASRMRQIQKIMPHG